MAGARWRWKGTDRSGRALSGVVEAEDARAAARRLIAEGLSPHEVKRDQGGAGFGKRASRTLTARDRQLVLRQLAVMLGAGVPLLMALDNVASAFPGGEMETRLRAAMAALRRGERLGRVFSGNLPGYPPYVYALLDAGEETGRLPEVLKEAADQMSFEDRLRRDVQNALAYPTFLAVIGGAAVIFLFYEVVPRFSALIGEDRSNLPDVSRFVLGFGDAVRENGLLIAIVAAAAGVLLAGLFAGPGGQARGRAFARAMPVIGGVSRARERVSWARILGFALSNGVTLIPSLRLAMNAVDDPKFRAGLDQAERALRAGADVDQALSGRAPLAPADLAVVRTGQKAGALGPMFLLLAENYEQDLRDAVKRATALVEPIALAMIAGVVGVIAVALALALSSVYDVMQ